MPIDHASGLCAAHRYLTTQDLSERWRLSRWTVRQLAKAGRIVGAERVGRDWRFAEGAVLVRAAPASSLERVSAEHASAAIAEMLAAHRKQRPR